MEDDTDAGPLGLRAHPVLRAPEGPVVLLILDGVGDRRGGRVRRGEPGADAQPRSAAEHRAGGLPARPRHRGGPALGRRHRQLRGGAQHHGRRPGVRPGRQVRRPRHRDRDAVGRPLEDPDPAGPRRRRRPAPHGPALRRQRAFPRGPPPRPHPPRRPGGVAPCLRPRPAGRARRPGPHLAGLHRAPGRRCWARSATRAAATTASLPAAAGWW